MKSWIDTPLPEGWKLSKNCEYCTILSGFPFSSTGFNTDGIGTPIVRIRDITSGHTETFYKGDFPISSLIENGDLLVGMDGDFNHCIWKSGRAILNQRCCKILCKNEWYKKYISYVLPFQLKLINELKNSTTVKHLNNTDILTASLPIPTDINILKRTVCFLDRNCNAVDRLVANMREKLLKLSEYRQSLITQAVTKGLDPKAEMKDSGVEWIGKIPAHWNIAAIKHCGQYTNGLTYSPQDLVADGTPVLRSTNVQNGQLDINDLVFVRSEVAVDSMLKAGDVLICSGNGSAKLIGKCAYISEEDKFAFGAFMMVFRSKLKKFGFYILNSALFSYYKPQFGTSTINQLTGKSFGEMLIPIPPDSEMTEIAIHLDNKIAQILKTENSIKNAIELLLKYRTSLISAAVTGKIDISEVNQ